MVWLMVYFIYPIIHTNETIRIYNPNCAGDLLGEIFIDNGNDVLIWGFYVNGNTWFASDAVSGNIYSGSANPADYTLPATNTGTLFASTGFAAGANVFGAMAPLGITRDASGNVYVLVNNIGGAVNPGELLKFDPAGNLVASIAAPTGGVNATDGLPGWSRSRGLVYSQSSGLLYLSGLENCIAVFDTNLVEQPTLNIGNPSETLPKGIGITTECCPLDPNVLFTNPVCNLVPGQVVALLDLITCTEGTICEGEWSVANCDDGLVYQACDNTITVNSSGCCDVSKISDGTSPNSRCGAINITLNICFGMTETPAISITDNDCAADTPGTINVDTPCTAGTLEFSTDGGTTWSTTAPTYDDTNPITVSARCLGVEVPGCPEPVAVDATSAPEKCCPSVNCINKFGEFTITKRRP